MGIVSDNPNTREEKRELVKGGRNSTGYIYSETIRCAGRNQSPNLNSAEFKGLRSVLALYCLQAYNDSDRIKPFYSAIFSADWGIDRKTEAKNRKRLKKLGLISQNPGRELVIHMDVIMDYLLDGIPVQQIKDQIMGSGKGGKSTFFEGPKRANIPASNLAEPLLQKKRPYLGAEEKMSQDSFQDIIETLDDLGVEYEQDTKGIRLAICPVCYAEGSAKVFSNTGVMTCHNRPPDQNEKCGSLAPQQLEHTLNELLPHGYARDRLEQARRDRYGFDDGQSDDAEYVAQ